MRTFDLTIRLTPRRLPDILIALHDGELVRIAPGPGQSPTGGTNGPRAPRHRGEKRSLDLLFETFLANRGKTLSYAALNKLFADNGLKSGGLSARLNGLLRHKLVGGNGATGYALTAKGAARKDVHDLSL